MSSSSILDLLIYRRDGTCLYNRNFTSHTPATQPASEREKLVYGMLFSLKELLPSLAPSAPTLKSIKIERDNEREPLTLHTMASPTGYTICMHTMSGKDGKSRAVPSAMAYNATLGYGGGDQEQEMTAQKVSVCVICTISEYV